MSSNVGKSEKNSLRGSSIWLTKNFIKKDDSGPQTRSSRIRKISGEASKASSPTSKPKTNKKTQSVPPANRKPSPSTNSSKLVIASPPSCRMKKPKPSKSKSSKVTIPLHEKYSFEKFDFKYFAEETCRKHYRINVSHADQLVRTSSQTTLFSLNTPFVISENSLFTYQGSRSNSILPTNIEFETSNEPDRDVSLSSDVSEMDTSNPNLKADVECNDIFQAMQEIVNACINGSPTEQSELFSKYECIGESLDFSLLSRFFGRKDKDREDSAKNVFQALVNSTDKNTTLLLIKLCRLITHGTPRVINAEICGSYQTYAKDLLERVVFLSGQSDIGTLAIFLLHLEILHSTLRDRPTRQRLIEEEGIVSLFLNITNCQFTFLHNSGSVENLSRGSTEFKSLFVRLDALIKAIDIVHLLSHIKSAKDEIVKLECLEMIRKGFDTLQSNVMKEFPRKRVLQDSLCSLYMSCLPTARFPLSGIPFPLSLELPTTIGPSSKATSPTKKGSLHKARNSFTENQDESLISEDDRFEDDEDVFTENENSRDGEMLNADFEKDSALSLAKQKFSDLSAYDPFFSEFTEDSLPTPLKDFEGYSTHFKNHVMKTASVVPFVKIAYPDLKDSDREQPQQPLLVSHDGFREAVLQQMSYSKKNVKFVPRTVYDFDELCMNSPLKSSPPMTVLSCDDASRLGKMNVSKDHLLFESRFECGNLRRVTQVSTQHYQLILNPDINQINDHYQWFYFEVSNMRANVPYTFEIINCLKSTSMYSHGMQPVMYSVRDAVSGNPRWLRVGDSVCYYRNLFTDDTFDADGEKNGKRSYFSIRFDVTFKSKGDVCYFAYHYPYTFSFMMTSIDRCYAVLNPSVHFRKDIIGHSLGGNPIVMLTATAAGTKQEVATRKVIVISARVHPGESNSSWIMHGLFNELLCNRSETVDSLLSKFVFKLIPMLNPDGVINGSHRCSLAGVDLNRVWDKPNRTLHPEIFHSKGIIQYLTDVCHRTPWMFIDFHGHSRKSSIFLFGNNPEQSYKSTDKKMQHENEFVALPEVLDKISPCFSIDNCRFTIVPSKESSARVTVWRQFGVARSYTMESTYSGFETGPLKGLQIGILELKKMGRELLSGILETIKVDRKKKKMMA
ncbi:unnamed protein product [Auanema sp. JU1783]|nr:unnamed protein product [Auanema sp. JU1783]